MKMIKAQDVPAALPPGAVILDVRTAVEHRAECLSCAHDHVPLDQLEAASYLAQRGLAADTPLYLLCRAGGRAAKAAALFEAAGCTQVHVIEGGLSACQACGVACARDEGVISLERQVRIAAGVLVLTGTILGITLDPTWHMLAGAIGGGLVFAGITNWCGMAMLLARAPWNKVGSK